VLNHAAGQLGFAARISEPESGRIMEVLTTEPGMQFYTGQNLEGTDRGKGGHVYAPRSAFCVETGHFPDSPNRPDFPTTVLRPGEQFRSTTVFRFGRDRPPGRPF
jgi:aldose 1-epimerase